MFGLSYPANDFFNPSGESIRFIVSSTAGVMRSLRRRSEVSTFTASQTFFVRRASAASSQLSRSSGNSFSSVCRTWL